MALAGAAAAVPGGQDGASSPGKVTRSPGLNLENANLGSLDFPPTPEPGDAGVASPGVVSLQVALGALCQPGQWVCHQPGPRRCGAVPDVPPAHPSACRAATPVPPPAVTVTVTVTAGLRDSSGFCEVLRGLREGWGSSGDPPAGATPESAIPGRWVLAEITPPGREQGRARNNRGAE